MTTLLLKCHRQVELLGNLKQIWFEELAEQDGLFMDLCASVNMPTCRRVHVASMCLLVFACVLYSGFALFDIPNNH